MGNEAVEEAARAVPTDFEKATKDVKDGDRVTVLLLQRGPQPLCVAFAVTTD